MIKNINVEGLKPEQIKEIQAMVEALKVKNQTKKNDPEIDMIEYLLENPIHVDNLEFMKREDIYERNP
ncbi:hypothetical protein [Crocosphaera sp.]|uniref:hypothetical protein n=1 Tax=Crocosphaera sp. TaxID=2729996 RepID=UPI00260C35DA|nr:hypothetical protein [Crocosphaera sp.]MDJ0579765.1 hypothetical protein [Crocosphaera sp.]